ncbi:MAG: exodeoxyribonuclease V subunit gamma [Pseudomonadales bacterium]
MLKVYHSNTLDTLRDVLVEMIARSPLQDPFCSEQILVQSPGMAQWLKLELAERLRIAANLDFPLPASFLWRTFAGLLEDVPEKSAYAKESMTWALMRLLPTLIEDDAFAPLANYMAGDNSELRWYQLCAKVADLFDEYLVYRPDWIASWQRGESAPASGEQSWQPILWRALVADTDKRGLPHWHRANMFDAFIEAINSAPAAVIPQRVFVFGISALPQNYLEALVALGRRCEIHLMVANPCRQFWGDLVDRRTLAQLAKSSHRGELAEDIVNLHEQGNPLLASMGKLGRDYLYMLQQMELPEVELFTEDSYRSLLCGLQSDILSLHSRNSGQSILDRNSSERLSITGSDSSVQVHSCHSAMREVEVLQDQLLAMLEENPALEPRDIIVMMPDVALYSPFVETVFGQASGARYLPFSISDRNAQQESPLIANFIALLNIVSGRFEVSALLELMSLPAVLRRFDLSAEQFEQLQVWVQASGVKWGFDGESRQELGLPAFAENSWTFGLDRMFAGFAMGDLEQTWQGIAPYGEVAGLEAASLGQLSSFIALLRRCQQQLESRAPMAQWIAFFNELIAELYAPDDNELAALELVYQALEHLQSTLHEVDYTSSIDAAIIIDHLSAGLQEQRSGQRFLSGQINFCTLMPMRAIPFKVVCLLGMNDGQYPRSLQPMGFDLMADFPRKGDRSRRDDDRYLFLEALLSAREKLYISFVGRSIADNQPMAPSVLVSELLEYIQQGFFLAGEPDNTEEASAALLANIRCEHLLTAYHKDYFDDASSHFSYSEQWLEVARNGLGDTAARSFLQPLPPLEPKAISLVELCTFFRQPLRYFLQHRLQVSFAEQQVQMEDEEPFALGGLGSYQIRDQLLLTHLRGNREQHLEQWLASSGQLPLGRAGEKALQKDSRDARELVEKIQPLLCGQLRRLSFDITLQAQSLHGWIEPLYDSGVVKYSAANSSGRIYITTWVEHLAACASGCSHRTYFRAVNEQFHFKPLPQEEACEYLSQLIALYHKGLQQPLPWLPDPSWKLFRADKPEKTLLELDKNYNQFDDPYIHRTYPRWQEIELGLVALTPQIFTPLQAYLVIDTQTEEP